MSIIHIIYFLTVIIITLIYLVSAVRMAKRSYRKGMTDGTNKAVEWFTVALAASGFQGKQLTDLLNTIVGHLNEFKEEQQYPDNKEKGGVN